jgi:hypothetical protein
MPDRKSVLAVVREWVTKAENDLKNAAGEIMSTAPLLHPPECLRA